MIYILFLIGFVLLIKGADILVDGSSSLAKRYFIPEIVIGLTIVSFGTSMPELIVNLLASINGSSEIAIGNVFGSNIANVLLILGISAMVKPLTIQRSTYFSEIPIMLMATFMVGFLANANLFGVGGKLILSHLDGWFLLLFFGLYMVYIYTFSQFPEQKERLIANPDQITTLSRTRSIIYILGGVTALFLGGKWVVEGAVVIARLFGLSETFIGLTIVAIGTSLPELFTSTIAAKKGQADLAVGNVIGSNIFNILWILGLSAAILPLPFNEHSNHDIIMMLFSSILLILALMLGNRGKIDRWEGCLFVVAYTTYLGYLLMRL